MPGGERPGLARLKFREKRRALFGLLIAGGLDILDTKRGNDFFEI
jgi:hypothetical protein